MPYSLTLTGSLVEDMAFPRRFRPCPRAVTWRGVRRHSAGGNCSVPPDVLPPGIWSGRAATTRSRAVSPDFNSRCSRALPQDGDGEARGVTFAVVVPEFRVSPRRWHAGRSVRGRSTAARPNRRVWPDGTTLQYGIMLQNTTDPKPSPATDTAVVSCIDALPPLPTRALRALVEEGVSALYRR